MINAESTLQLEASSSMPSKIMIKPARHSTMETIAEND